MRLFSIELFSRKWYNHIKGCVIMKETIYTIPINEALEKDCFCPLCEMYKDLERSEVKYAVGPAMMEPDFRELTNQKGFCKKHVADLNAESKALALALVFDTHLAEIENIMGADLSEKKALFRKDDSVEKFVSELKNISDSCVICERIESTFERYIDNFVYLLKKDHDFPEKVLKTKGFCMEHFTALAAKAKEEFSDYDFKKYFLPIAEHQKNRVSQTHKYIKNFVDSFDYRNAGKPMDAPKDILMQTSYLLNGEFEKKEKKLDNI